MTFGLLIDWISSAYHQEIWLGIQRFCQNRGINLLTLVTGRTGSPFRWEQLRNQLLEFVDGRHFDGFLFMTATLGNHLEEQQFRQLLSRVSPAPVVSLGAVLDGTSTVLVNNRTGFRQLLDHLYDVHGHRRFAYAGGSRLNADAQERRNFLFEFFADRNLEPDPSKILSGEFEKTWGREAVDRLIPGAKPDFDVLICANDDIAIGALEALAQKGLQVPGDLAITGFDDVPTSGLAALTTVRQPLENLGHRAARRLLEAIEEGLRPTIQLDSFPVIRRSCGCLSPAARLTQVEPRSESELSFPLRVAAHEEQLLHELAAEGLSRADAGALSHHFLEAWELQDTPVFLNGLQHLLDTMATRALSPGDLHYPLSVLRRWVLQSTEPALRRAFVETTIHQARILLSEALHIQAVQKETHQLFLKDILSDLNERLIYSREFSDQAQVMLTLFPKLGIGAFRMTLYDDPAHPMDAAHLVLTERGQEPGGGIAYDPKTLFAPARKPLAEPWFYIAEALFDQTSPLGFFLLDSQGKVELLPVFDQLCERVGRGIETVRRIHALEGQVAQRTAELKKALEDLERRNETLKGLALRDEMTGLYNRRGFLTLAEHQIRAHGRKNRPLVLFFGDLDGLKTINDTRGHEAGDEAIRTAGRLLTETFRAEDVIARLGGDEFVVLAPACSAEEAGVMAERLAAAFALDVGGYRISLGWIVVEPKANRPLAEWMKDADDRLYEEKQRKKAYRR